MTVQLMLSEHPRFMDRFLPFLDARPLGELRYGAWLLRERWERALGVRASGYTAAVHPTFVEAGAPPVNIAPGNTDTVVTVLPGFVPALGATIDTSPAAFTNLVAPDGERVGTIAPAGFVPPAMFDDQFAPQQTVPGRLLSGIWDIVADLPAALKADLEAERMTRDRGHVPAGCTVIGDVGRLLIDEGAIIEPLVVFDTRNGPIWIQEGAEIRSGSRLAGSLLIGAGTRVQGGQLRESSIGPMCVVHGELSNSIFLGYANKAHDGFVGHTIVGRWANLGAGTITSNLKNTYGTIRLTLGTERIETGMQFLGSLIGDHVKTAIGTMLPTGCVIGTGANVFGARRPAASVKPFAWGTDEPDRVVACRMFLQTAAKVMPRRNVAFDDATTRYLEAVWARCTGRACD